MAAHILVVDDSFTVRRMVQAVLTGAGFRVSLAENAEQGLELAVRERPDLVLLDLIMPSVDGYGFCEQLERKRGVAEILVIMMTTRGEHDSERLLHTPCVVDSIAKPVGAEGVLAVISHTLDKHARFAAKQSPMQSEPSLLPGPALTAQSQPPAAVPPRSLEEAALQHEAHAQAQTPEASLGALAAALVEPLRKAGVPDPLALARSAAEEALHQLPSIVARTNLAGTSLWCDLAQVALPEVLQLMQLQGQSGLLQMWHKRTRFDIYLRQGQVIAARATNAAQEFLLGRFLVTRGHIGQSELDQIVRSAQGSATLPLGEKLLRLGLIHADDLQQAIRDQCCELVYEALRLGRGTCRFVANQTPPPEFDAMVVDVGMQELLLEGLRRIDEWGVIEREVESFDTVFRPRPANGEELTSQERRLLSLVNGQRSVRELVQASRMRPFEACKLLYRLATTRSIVRTGRPQPPETSD